jgi:hypothetical protein
MRLGRTLLVTLLAAFVLYAGVPSATAASGNVVGSGPAHMIDVTAQTMMVGRHTLTLDYRSRLYDLRGRILTLAELKERFDGDEARFEAYAVAGRMRLRSLRLAGDIEAK